MGMVHRPDHYRNAPPVKKNITDLHLWMLGSFDTRRRHDGTVGRRVYVVEFFSDGCTILQSY